MIFNKQTNLNYKLYDSEFYPQGYSVSTVGSTSEDEEAYPLLRETRHVQDKLMSREYQAPFKEQGKPIMARG
ncbi:MAG: hypothetical protein BCS36_05555 [Desulfovibrio sp. MES5]|nr:MAG: hypothetical protein BCS36_05555 [Desulfovibrio sp. MES5]